MNNIEKGFNYEKQIKNSIIENTIYNAYLWNECPETILIENNLIKSSEHNKNIRKAIKEGTLHNHKDIGIDIIQVDSNNICVGIIQCKNGYLNGVCIKDIAGIMTRSAFNKLLPAIIYYTDKLSSNLNMLIDLNTNVYKTDFSKINYETNNIYFIKEPYITNKIISNITPIIFTPYEYQLEAVNKIEDNFIISNRSILAIPCGCGKTYISYLISLNYKKIIIISPLIEFSSQNLSRYIEYGYDKRNIILINSDGIRDIDIIKTKIKENEKLLISSTFKSMDIINECLDLFDEDTLFIIDEFHNLSKNNISDKDDDIYKLLITNHKILFMSATPRIYDIEYLDEDDYDDDNEDDNENSIIDYDSKFDELFGKIVYNMSLTDAIINKYITDYKIWLPSIHENKDELNKELSIYDINDEFKNRCKYLFSCLSNNGSRKTIIYCKDTNDMNNMIDSVNKLNDFYNLDIDIYSISCENTNKERKNILKSFSKTDDKIQLLFNIKILNECIDIPSCDSIYISYPPKNKITTIQRINRATRINKNNPYKIANIYIWCDEYEEILETLSSIKEYDIMFKDKIKINAINFYHNINDKELKLIENDKILLSNYTLGIKEFKCLTWYEKLTQVEEYIIENGIFPSSKSKEKNIKNIGIWIGKQKRDYKNNQHIMINKEICKQWEEFTEKYKDLFKTNEEIWRENLKELDKYINKNKLIPPIRSKIGSWFSHQKLNYKNNLGILKNIEIKQVFEIFLEKNKDLLKTNEEIWYDNLKELEEYIKENKKIPTLFNNDKLSRWIQNQKRNYKNNENIMKINEEIKKQWEEFTEKYKHLFRCNEEMWYDNLKELEEYIKKYNKLPKLNEELYVWLYMNKNNYKNNSNIMKNNEIKEKWNEFTEKYKNLFRNNEEIWYESLKELEEYINKYNKLPSQIDKNIDIKKLGSWLSTQKQNYINIKCIMKEEEIRKKWEEFIEKYKDLFKSNEEIWYEKLKELEIYIIDKKKLPSEYEYINNIKQKCYIGKWLLSQKEKYKNNQFPMKDKEIRKQWEEFTEKYKDLFKTNEEIWCENLKELDKYIKEYNKFPDKKNIYIYRWLYTQKQNYKNNENIMKINEEIKKQWEEFTEKYKHLFRCNEEMWYDNLKELEEYIKKYNKLPSNKSKDVKVLGCWLYTQKQNYKNNENIMKINEEIKKEWEEFIEKYEELFKTNKELWIDNLKKLEEFINKYNKLPSDKNIAKLGNWLSKQKQNYKNKEFIMKDKEIKNKWEEFIEIYKELF